MKKILFSIHCNTVAHKDIALALLHIVASKEYKVDVMSNQKLKLEDNCKQIPFSTDNLTDDYDAVFAYNRKGYNRIRKYSYKKNIPVFYIVGRRDSINEYVYDIANIRQYIVINDGGEFNSRLFPQEYTLHIPYPFLPTKVTSSKSSESDKAIVVCTDDETLFKIIPMLNQQHSLNFTIICGFSSAVKKVANSNIKVIVANDTALIDNLINQADLVIGSGLAILKGVYYQTPAIVVGEYGFGRLLTEENVEQHFNSFFRGRLGAQKNEIILNHLLSYEITTFFEQSSDTIEQQNSKLFRMLPYNPSISILSLLDSLYKPKENVFTQKMRLTSLYSYIEMDENEYLVVDERMTTFCAIMEKEEYDWLMLFKQSSTPEKVFPFVKNKDKRTFVEYIEYLITHKFLIPYNEQAYT